MKKRYVSIVTVVIFLVAFSFHTALAEGWKQSFHAGTFDKNLNYMGGTETMNLVAHKGKLYAGFSYWMDWSWSYIQYGITGKPTQILVKDSVDGEWRLDYQADKYKMRVDSLCSLTFTTDATGAPLPQPVTLLLAGLCDATYPTGEAVVCVRDDNANQWIKTKLMDIAAQTGVTIRAIGLYRDKVTGIDRVFAGSYPGGIFSGVYDPTKPGNIRWENAPEFSDYNDRVMSFAKCNGELYAAIKPAIYKRVDGPNPAWKKVYEYTTYPGDGPSTQGGSSGMRALTAIPNQKGKGEVLLMALEGFGSKIVYLDPSDNNSVTTELVMDTYFEKQWGEDWRRAEENKWNYVVTAYNDMVPVTDPKTGEDLLLMGLLAYNISTPDTAWYLVRHPDATYTLHEIPYIFDLRGSPKSLPGTRAIRVSPFAEDKGQVLYFGGHDCIGKTSHNTAWIYSVDIGTVLGE